MEQIRAHLDQYQNRVFFFSKTGCTYCDILADELTDLKIPFEKITLGDLDQIAAVKEITGLTTFPMLFFGNRQIGGFKEFTKIASCNGLPEALDTLGIIIEPQF
jgi:glutaredoxin